MNSIVTGKKESGGYEFKSTYTADLEKFNTYPPSFEVYFSNVPEVTTHNCYVRVITKLDHIILVNVAEIQNEGTMFPIRMAAGSGYSYILLTISRKIVTSGDMIPRAIVFGGDSSQIRNYLKSIDLGIIKN